jgi:hypothetical protein
VRERQREMKSAFVCELEREREVRIEAIHHRNEWRCKSLVRERIDLACVTRLIRKGEQFGECDERRWGREVCIERIEVWCLNDLKRGTSNCKFSV